MVAAAILAVTREKAARLIGPTIQIVGVAIAIVMSVALMILRVWAIEPIEPGEAGLRDVLPYIEAVLGVVLSVSGVIFVQMRLRQAKGIRPYD